MIAEKNVNLAIVDDALYGSHLTHTKETPDLARYERLRDRLADEVTAGMTLKRVVIEIGKPGRYYGDSVSEQQIVRWSSDPDWGRDWSPYVNDGSSQAGRLENSLEALFSRLDEERASAPFARPGVVETSITTAVIDALAMARKRARNVVCEIPSGCGKTTGIEEYMARVRKAEGFGCPVWRIDMTPAMLKLKPVLASMLLAAQGLDPAENWSTNDPEHVLQWKLMGATAGRGGLFIFDDAQGFGDSKNEQGEIIFNQLRHFTDKRLFGLAFFDNGELYTRLKGGRHTQLSSRIEAGRVKIDRIADADIDLIMAAWGVSGAKESAYCRKLARQPGHFRLLCEVFERCLEDFGTINHTLLQKVRAVS
jgi:hypothetical protein